MATVAFAPIARFGAIQRGSRSTIGRANAELAGRYGRQGTKLNGPLPPHELAMPTEEGRRSDEEGDPAVTPDDPTRRRQEDPVDGPELEWVRRPLQHPELMAENEDLEILGSVGSTRVSSAEEETDEGADDEVEEG
jgi:hypothetical protein